MVAEERFELVTPRGPVPAVMLTPEQARAVLVLGHGAGAGMEHPFLAGFCAAMAERAVASVRFDFPYKAAGRRTPDPAPVAAACVVAAVAAARARLPGATVLVGGKSYGARMASIAVADGLAVDGLVFLGYPLHPPGRPQDLRDQHLDRITAPMLFLQGTRDPFAEPDRLASVLARLGARATYVPVEGGGHSFERSRRDDAAAVGAGLAGSVATWIEERLG
ncbi:MAG: alpha/beta hydrolase [Actinomycetota bacterium]|nr:MAG: alpha/beta hydrolase [Actinomycetota bacterium]